MTRRKPRTVLSFLAWAMLFFLSAHARTNASAVPSLFQPQSLQEIENSYAGQAFLLVLWSLDCPPCRQELELLGTIKQRHPDLNLVLVSMDTADSSGQLTAVLAEHQLDKVSSWVFSEVSADRLRYVIDADWYGEIPRSYFYDRQHQRIAVSGALNTTQIEDWLDAVKTAH